MSCTTLRLFKKIGSTIAILIFAIFAVWTSSFTQTLSGMASAIAEPVSPPSQELSNEPPALPSQPSSTSSTMRNEDLLRLRELQTRLVTLSAQYTSAHPDVVDVKQQIADLKARLEQKAGPEIHLNTKLQQNIISPQNVRATADVQAPTENAGTSAPSRDITAEEKAELTETARLLAVLLDSGRVVVGRAQSAINNPRLEDKGFSSAVFEERLRKEFLTRTGHDLRNLAPAQMPEGAKVLLVRLSFFMQKSVQEAQPLINQKGIGFKGFIPASFATRVAEKFSKDTGLTLRQIGPPSIAPRNP